MSCINPLSLSIKSHGVRQNIEVPCGHCLNCLIKKKSQIEFLTKKELLYNYLSGKSASFVTLTYSDDNLPINENGFVTLNRKHLRDFIKRMRRNMDYHNNKIQFKYLYCGEYGDGSHETENGNTTCRPHYHIVFIGLSPEQIKYYTRKLWPFGLCDVGPLTNGGITYLCKYMLKSTPDRDVKAFRQLCNVQNPFFFHSIGMGKKWIEDNLDKIVQNNFTFNLNGKKMLFPKYVMQFVSFHTGINYKPYVINFLKETRLFKAKKQNISYQQYDFEESFIKYQYKVAALRSQNKPINDITMSKKWVRPIHTLDRRPNYKKLADLALYGDVVPF